MQCPRVARGHYSRNKVLNMYYVMDTEANNLHVFEEMKKATDYSYNSTHNLINTSKEARKFIEKECLEYTCLTQEQIRTMKVRDLLLELIECDPYANTESDKCIYLNNITLHW